MARPLLILFILLLAIALRGQDAARTAAPTWQVDKYDIEITVPQDTSRAFAANSVLTIKNISGRPASTLTLRISPLADVSAVKINGASAEFSKNEEKVGATSLQRVIVRLPSVAADQVVSASVEYRLPLKENTALGSISSTNAQLLPLSYWYPTPNSWYFPRGADRAPVRLKVSGGTQVISSGTGSNGTFEQKLRVQPFFLNGAWDASESDGVSLYLPKDLSSEGKARSAELAKLFREAITHMSGILGPAPDVPLRIVATRRGAGFGGGGTVLVDEAVFRRPKLDSLTAMNVAEAAAKLWLGEAVTVNGDGYGIVSEGLARYFATGFIDSRFGKEVANIERLRQRNAYSAVSKRDSPMTVVAPIDDYYYPVVANKGAMAWRILAKRIGNTEFLAAIKRNSQDGALSVSELRTAFSAHKPLIDFLFDQVTEMNLLVGLPQAAAGETKAALRNTGATDVTVDVEATTASGQRLIAPATIRAADYGEVSFRTNEKIVRVEVDAEKLYPQADYSDDIAPRELTDSDQLLAVKRAFDKQDFVTAEKLAKTALTQFPQFDDVRVLLGRSLLAQNKTAEAEKEFRAVLNEKLPTARSLAWATVGLADLASRAGQNDAAIKLAESAIAIDAEYGASFAARTIRGKIASSPAADSSIKSFFADFDKAASANRKADLEALTVPGEVTRFISGLTGSTEQWQTAIRYIDRIDANTVLVEANMAIKLLNREQETGVAVFRLARAGNSWKLSAVDMFEVR